MTRLRNRTGHRLHVGIFLPDFARRFQSFKKLNEISFVTASSNGPKNRTFCVPASEDVSFANEGIPR